MNKRIIFDLVLLVAVFCTPWWTVAILGFAGVFSFSRFYEIVVFGLLVDLMYGVSSPPFFGMVGVTTAVVIFYTARHTRRAVR